MKTKHLTSMRLTAEAKAILTSLAQAFGISQAAVMEVALRHLAQEHAARSRRAGQARKECQ